MKTPQQMELIAKEEVSTVLGVLLCKVLPSSQCPHTSRGRATFWMVLCIGSWGQHHLATSPGCIYELHTLYWAHDVFVHSCDSWTDYSCVLVATQLLPTSCQFHTRNVLLEGRYASSNLNCTDCSFSCLFFQVVCYRTDFFIFVYSILSSDTK